MAIKQAIVIIYQSVLELICGIDLHTVRSATLALDRLLFTFILYNDFTEEAA